EKELSLSASEDENESVDEEAASEGEIGSDDEEAASEAEISSDNEEAASEDSRTTSEADVDMSISFDVEQKIPAKECPLEDKASPHAGMSSEEMQEYLDDESPTDVSD
uniref:Protein SDA1 n=1 Tax=Panagrellus redivivus TaxID=6233 RepID=A0A7E4VVW1_PANRE